VVICSLSKPSFEVFKQLDEIVLLSDGYSIFSGPPRLIESHFCDKNMGYSKQPSVDLVDFLLDIASGVERPINQRNAEHQSVMQKKFEISGHFDSPETNSVISAFSPSFFKFWGYSRIDNFSDYMYRSYVIIERGLYTKIKDFEIIKVSAAGSILIALLLGYLQYNDGQFGYYCQSFLGLPYVETCNLTSLMFFIGMFSYGLHVIQLHVICQKVQLFRYELSSGCCTIGAFLLSTFIAELPFSILNMLLFGNILYWLVGINLGLYNYFFFIILIVMNNLVGLSSSYLLVSVLKKEYVVRDVFLSNLLIMLLVSGFPFQLKNMPSYIAQSSQLTPIRFFLFFFINIMVVNENICTKPNK
jgi:hypothetical protein